MTTPQLRSPLMLPFDSFRKTKKQDPALATRHLFVEEVCSLELPIPDLADSGVQNSVESGITIAQRLAGTQQNGTGNNGLNNIAERKNEAIPLANMKSEPKFDINSNSGLDSFSLDADESNAPDFLHGGQGMGI
eukprot:gb/GEZJ01001471.1/.p3 GENE.gb/GEZJ01001471.1/~~gb/GEZJ01001471.1/.p3  ORF type:complete len:134 (+),score=25.02 gb/GEZJ01001471.1/:2386-2787(+)